MTNLPDRVATVLTTYTKSTILVVLLLTAAFGVGIGEVEQQSDTDQFETDSPAADAQEFIDQNMTADDEEAILQIVQRGENVFTKESILQALDLQQFIRETESIDRTLVTDRPVFGYATVIANAAPPTEAEGQETDRPSLAEQRARIEALDDDDIAEIAQEAFGPDAGPEVLGLMPSAFEPGSTTAESGSIVVRQQLATGVQDPDAFPADLTQAQLDIREFATNQDAEYAIFGFGILNDEIDQSLGDSGAIVGPLALLFVVVALTVAYRDLLDIVLGVFGIVAVLVWTFGFMGWTGVAFNQLLLSVPVLLIGLSIDYAIHVFMRYREQRAESASVDLRQGMLLALAGVGTALVWVTATAAIGFLANLTSPIGPLQDFGIVSAFGVVAALVVFGALVPALKIEIDGLLEARGIDRQKRAFGTGGSVFTRVLASGASAARRFPVAVVVLALVLSAGGAVGATQVDTSFDETDFLADSPPDWTSNLPGAMAPGDYQVKDDLEFIGANYQQEGTNAQVLIRGDVTNPEVLRWLDGTRGEIGELDTAFVGPDGPAVQSPLTVMQQTAAEGRTVAETVPPDERTERQAALVAFADRYDDAAAASEDGIPDRDIAGLYDDLLAANPEAGQFVHRTDDGTYDALRLQFGVVGDAEIAAIAGDTRTTADTLADRSGGTLETIATGEQVVFDIVQEDLLDTVIQGLVITLVSVFIFLAVAYRATGSPASLGVVTLVPVALAVTWILGSMWLLDIPFNTLTGTITSLTVGLGIAYSIHISSRYELELRRQGDVWKAMQTTVTGTGGALLGSAATTIGGFGTLVFAVLPVLRQFGIITGLTILYAFLASVLVLPSMLALWTRYLGPSGYFPSEPDESTETPDEQVAADGPAVED